ncbi:hypothetical protein PILCRDRAFT_12673 [Piloderma croceum F 1598]|uniref:Uncharacterized protein n=1 Tax=Piloderma croceum (strain F 1598) TaxID=765440 RepID=A0A0C3EVU5_PILCF|nr:hypothetical protein PILCRDRAFT_12673 [Piloderma croceum F 1598]
MIALTTAGNRLIPAGLIDRTDDACSTGESHLTSRDDVVTFYTRCDDISAAVQGRIRDAASFVEKSSTPHETFGQVRSHNRTTGSLSYYTGFLETDEA